ncbi:hypothetical protein GOP47_0020206 [Adiantum capillus-veneris]|uniref:Uncharacterized protein n=1 Tax=Adiantum capillus-veneris TaxID=13818 RepID=A0A9D4UCK5_ADICA|nr:hypothetical protein GOP47_0020206 [Adiantum capillus-veneris]
MAQILPHSSSSALVGAKLRVSGLPFSSSTHMSFGALGTKRLPHEYVEFLTSIKWLSWRGPVVRREPGLVRVSANFKAEEPRPPEMSMESALQILGVAEGAAFEDVIRAKSSLLSKHGGDADFALQVEAAYDVLLMQSLMQRRLGKVADNSVRYADVKKAKAFSHVGELQRFSEALSKVPIGIKTPSSSDFATQTAVFAGLAVWTFASEVSSQPSLHAKSDVPGVILAVGVGASIYFLRKQNVNLGWTFNLGRKCT